MFSTLLSSKMFAKIKIASSKRVMHLKIFKHNSTRLPNLKTSKLIKYCYKNCCVWTVEVDKRSVPV